ncbi:MAG: helix-turn-helix domain-containing protein [Bacteroidota bacterium]
MKKPVIQRSPCPISSTLDILGDKWTLLIVRDMLRSDKHRYGDFLTSKEGIRTNILADRLRRLCDHNIVEKKAYQENPLRYEYHLTPKGKDLAPLVNAALTWGLKHLPNVSLPPTS